MNRLVDNLKKKYGPIKKCLYVISEIGKNTVKLSIEIIKSIINKVQSCYEKYIFNRKHLDKKYDRVTSNKNFDKEIYLKNEDNKNKDIIDKQIFNVDKSDSLIKKDECILNLQTEEMLLDYIKRLNNVDNIIDYLKSNPLGEKFIKYIERYKLNIEKIDKEIDEIDEEINEKVAEYVISIIKKYLTNYLIGCYRGYSGSNADSEKDFYRNFEKEIEKYLESIYVYKENIEIGMSINENDIIDSFEDIRKRKTDNEDLVEKINEIELKPHYIKYINEYEEESLLYLGGICVVWVKEG